MADDSSDSEGEVEFEKECFDIRNYSLNITTIAFMPIHKLMQLNQNSSEISGQKLWCGSLVLCEYLLDHSEYCVDNVIIELGAGTGVSGMVGAKLGAKVVFLTDYDVKSLQHMQTDCDDNKITAEVVGFDYYHPDYSIFSPHLIEREIRDAVESSSSLLATHDTVFSSVSNASDTVPRVRIMAGDVIYKKELIEAFLNVVHTLVHKYHADMLLCHIPRAGVDHEVVTQAMDEVQLAWDIIPATEWCKGVVEQYSPKDDYDRAKLYHITAKSV